MNEKTSESPDFEKTSEIEEEDEEEVSLVDEIVEEVFLIEEQIVKQHSSIETLTSALKTLLDVISITLGIEVEINITETDIEEITPPPNIYT